MSKTHLILAGAALLVVFPTWRLSADGGENPQRLREGKYELWADVPGPAPVSHNMHNLVFPAVLTIHRHDGIIIKTQAANDTAPQEYRGTMVDGIAKFGLTGMEKGNIIVTFHFLGQIQSDASASGTLHCFIDGNKVYDGVWKLRRLPAEGWQLWKK